jgi:hypothetical protein
MERTNRNPVPPCAEMLTDPEGQPLGRVTAPRPGPVVGRASGTVYLNRQPRFSPAISGRLTNLRSAAP